jgi:dolichol-phosphate mannosyltransferase
MSATYTAGELREPGVISVVTPMLDEEAVAHAFYERVASALEGLDWELVIVDDGSTDGTPALLDALSEEDARVGVVHLSRSFGHQAALSAGLDHARGDAVVTIDADLQDPPEVIPQMVERWREGNDVVVAVRRTRAGEPKWRTAAIKTFYKLFGRAAGVEHAANAGDFRLCDRRALNVLLEMPERSRYLRGMARWIGFRQANVLYDRDERLAGETKYPLFKLIRLGLDALVSFSDAPLRLASYLGFIFASLAFLGLPLGVVARLIGIYVPGIASVIMIVCFFGGVQLITVGIIGEYVGRIYQEVKRRPLYVVRSRVGRASELDGPPLRERHQL